MILYMNCKSRSVMIGGSMAFSEKLKNEIQLYCTKRYSGSNIKKENAPKLL